MYMDKVKGRNPLPSARTPWQVKTNKRELRALEKHCCQEHNCITMNPAREMNSDAHTYPELLRDMICQLLSMEQSRGLDWDVSDDHSRDNPSPSSEISAVDNADDGEPFAGFL